MINLNDVSKELVYKDEVYAIYGAAIEVHRHLGAGFLEAVYQEALSIELMSRGIPFRKEQLLPIMYKGEPLKKVYQADFLCFGKIVVELKALRKLNPIDVSQAINYLKATNFRLGLLINFGSHPKLERERVLNKYHTPSQPSHS